MRLLLLLFFFIMTLGLASCAAVKDGTTAAGTAVGKGADSLGGLSEGVVDGYSGADQHEENPYNR